MKLTIVVALTISACCFFVPIKSSYYLIKVANDKANGTNEEILHDQPKEKDRGEEEKSKNPPANKPDHSKGATETVDKKQAVGRVSHSSFKMGHILENTAFF